MRLIDADVLSQDIKSRKYINKALSEIFEIIIDEQPTIGDGDITPEMAAAAYNVVRQYADNRTSSECNTCVFTDICIGFCACPDCWPELEVPDVQKP